MPPYTKHSKYKPRKPRTALVFFSFPASNRGKGRGGGNFQSKGKGGGGGGSSFGNQDGNRKRKSPTCSICNQQGEI